MKAYHEQLLIPDDELFLLKKSRAPFFTTRRHFHRELEFKYMIAGHGKGFIGESIYDYSAGDLVLLGPNLPHHWVSGNHFETSGLEAECYYLQFKEDFLGDEFLQKRAFKHIEQLFHRSRSGIRFTGKAAKEAGKILGKLETAQGTGRFVLFIEMLDLLARSYEYTEFEKAHFFEKTADREDAGLKKVYQYISKNYMGDISLDTAAGIVQMSKPAFCAYFKKRTLKTFSEFVNEMRIWEARRLLGESNKSIKEIGYACGFNNLSLFNRTFKKLTGKPPKLHRKRDMV